MGKRIANGLLCACALAAVQACAWKHRLPLDAVQGGWWSDCDDQSAVLVIAGDQYSGDFAGRHALTVDGDVLVLTEGLPEGHGIEVAHEALSFRVLAATGGRLVLRPLSGPAGADDWHLRSCDGMSDNARP